MPPIKPSEIVKQIPEQVFDAFNHFITQNFDGTQSVVRQDDVVEMLTKAGMDRGDIFNKHLLDVEAHYKKAGWVVSYEKPGYNEPGDAYFTFKKKSKK